MNHPDNTNTAVREQVKDALRSLAPHNIKYNELVGEGVDPYLLQGLYAELDSNDVQLKAPCPPSHSGRDAGAPNKPLPEKQPALHVIGDLSGGSGQQAQQATKTADTESVLPSVSSVPETPTPQSVTDTVKTSASAVINSENSTSGAPPFIVAMERKDRIAQLLAAKTGKALPPRPTPEKQPLPSPKVTISESPVEAVKKPQNLPEKPPLPLSESSNRPRNKAQTELIRQKMEALKREALGKAQGEGTTKAGLITSSPISALPSTAPQLQQQRPPVDPADIETGGFEAQIPGLFMASEASPSFPNSTNGTAENVPMTKPVDAISVSSTGTPLSRGTSADIPSESVRSPSGQPLPVRVPQKRPLAADSFDEHALSNKRPFGRKESSGKVEIVISEGESEGEVEDVEMELDEESDEENRDDQDDVVPAVSIKQQNIRNLPPLTGMPPQKPSVQSAGRIGTPTATALQTPTSTGAQTPGKENDKEQLWKAKNQEIEQMRKKIAEMEERRKAKQNANLAKSPSAAGKAGLPAIRTSLARPSQPASSAPTISAPTNTQPAKQSVATEVEKPSDPMKSPSLAASKPDGLPSTPSTPLYAIREPLKADDLRQQLLARKFTRDTTPSAAEMEVRQAQLAEKRAKLAELRREAERREAEILEESKLLEAQLQAELNDESYEQPPSDLEGKVEDDGKAMGRSSSDVMPCDQTDVPGTHLEELPVAVTASPVSVPQTSLLTHETVLSPANEGDITGKKSMPSIAGGMFSPNKGAMQGLPEKPPSTIPSLPAKMATAPPHSHSPEVSVIEDGHLHISLPPPVNEEGLTRGTQPDIVEPNLVDDDGSVSMSDSASEDYEPAEPEQMHDDQAEDDSESYEPADPAISADPDKSSALQQEIAEPIDTEQNLGKGLSELTTSTNRDSEPPILLDDAEDGMQLTEPDVINKPQLLSQSRSDERYDKVCFHRMGLSPI